MSELPTRAEDATVSRRGRSCDGTACQQAGRLAGDRPHRRSILQCAGIKAAKVQAGLSRACAARACAMDPSGCGGLPDGSCVLVLMEDRRQFFLSTSKAAVSASALSLRWARAPVGRSYRASAALVPRGSPRPVSASWFPDRLLPGSAAGVERERRRARTSIQRILSARNYFDYVRVGEWRSLLNLRNFRPKTRMSLNKLRDLTRVLRPVLDQCSARIWRGAIATTSGLGGPSQLLIRSTVC